MRQSAANLLRIARLFDANPAFKVLLPFVEKSCAQSAVPAARWIGALGRQFLGTGLRYCPEEGEGPSLRDFVEHVLRKSPNDLSVDEGFLRESSLVAQHMLMQLVELAKPGLTAEELDLPHLTGMEDELHFTHDVEPGTMLLSNPADTFPGREVLVALDLQSSGETLVDVTALAVHRPFPFTVGEMIGVDLGPLTNNYVFHGGREDEEIYLVHSFPDLRHSSQLTDNGLSVGGDLQQITELIEEGAATRNDFKVVMGRTKLVLDTEEGVFRDLPGCQLATGPAVRDLAMVPAMVEAPAASKKEGVWRVYDHDRFFQQNVVWAEAMRRLGGECAVLGRLHPAVVEAVQEALDAPDAAESGALEDRGEARVESER